MRFYSCQMDAFAMSYLTMALYDNNQGYIFPDEDQRTDRQIYVGDHVDSSFQISLKER